MEIFYNGEWGTVCEDLWDLRDAVVVCRQLGYATALRASIGAEFGEGTGRIWLDNVYCSGTESMLSECNARSWGSHNCYHTRDAGVVCARKFKISTACNGTYVRICVYTRCTYIYIYTCMCTCNKS